MKKQKLFILCAVLCAAILCGCTNSQFIIDNKADTYSNIKKYSERDHFFFWGMGKKHEHDSSKICPNGKIVKMLLLRYRGRFLIFNMLRYKGWFHTVLFSVGIIRTQ